MHLAPRHTMPLRLDAAFYRALRHYAVDQERPLHDIVVEVLEQWWAKQAAVKSPK